MSRFVRPSVLLAVVLLLTGCGSRVDHDVVTAGLRDETPPPVEAADVRTDPSSLEVAASEDPGPAENDRQPTSAAAVPETPVDPAPSGGEGWAQARASDLVQVIVEPSCVQIGEAVAATITTVPEAHLTLVVSYSDGRPHGQMAFAEAGEEGSYVWRWVIAPSVPPGEALAFVAATDHAGDRGDWTTQPFEVAGPEGC